MVRLSEVARNRRHGSSPPPTRPGVAPIMRPAIE